MPATAPIRISNFSGDNYFEEELNKAPENHFLSPIQMHEYEDWDSDSDGGEEVEWDAGITDFALFNNDRRRAQEQHEKVLPDRWNQLLANQASALQRATQRNRANSDPSLDDIPQLTPDNSPSLKDGFDMDAHFSTFGHKPQAPRPNFLEFRPTRTSKDDLDDASDDSEFDSEDEEEADLPLSLIIKRAKERQRAARMFERPGLRFNRTLSGKQHVWRRPSHDIYSLREDVAGERKAEHDYYHQANEDGLRRSYKNLLTECISKMQIEERR